MALDTGKLIRRSHAKVIPMTAEVIAQVNYLGQGKKPFSLFRTGKERISGKGR